MKFRKKPIVVDAYQWFEVSKFVEDVTRDVEYYRHPNVSGTTHCEHCNKVMHVHGWIDTLEGGHIVCPGDWIITGIEGEHYPCKPDIFNKTYEKVEPTYCKRCGQLLDEHERHAKYCIACHDIERK